MTFGSSSSDPEERLLLSLFPTKNSPMLPPGKLIIGLYISITND